MMDECVGVCLSVYGCMFVHAHVLCDCVWMFVHSVYVSVAALTAGGSCGAMWSSCDPVSVAMCVVVCVVLLMSFVPSGKVVVPASLPWPLWCVRRIHRRMTAL